MNKSLKIVLISTIIFFGIIGGYIIWEETQYQPITNNQSTFRSIPQPSFSGPTIQSDTTTQSTITQGKLYSGCFQQTGDCFKNVSESEWQNILEMEKAKISAKSTPTFKPFDYQVPDIAIPTPSLPNIEPYKPYTEFQGDYPEQQPNCTKVFKGKWMTVCN
mgnify:CR=1 FL=1